MLSHALRVGAVLVCVTGTAAFAPLPAHAAPASSPVPAKRAGTAPVLGATMTGAVGQNGATIVGTLDDGGVDTDYWVEYGETDFATETLPHQTLAAGSGSTGLSINVTGLDPDTDYQARLVAENENGVRRSAVIPFHTDPDPMATQQPVVDVSALVVTPAQDSVTLNGVTVDPNGLQTTYYLQYGPQGGAWTGKSANQLVSAAAGVTPISATITGLDPDTPYQARWVVRNADGAFYGQPEQFRTDAAPIPPVPAVAAPVVVVTTTTADLTDKVTPGSENATWFVEYGLEGGALNQHTAAQSVPSSVTEIPLGETLTGLLPDTAYQARFVYDTNGTKVYGTTAHFRTDAEPSVVTPPLEPVVVPPATPTPAAPAVASPVVPRAVPATVAAAPVTTAHVSLNDERRITTTVNAVKEFKAITIVMPKGLTRKTTTGTLTIGGKRYTVSVNPRTGKLQVKGLGTLTVRAGTRTIAITGLPQSTGKVSLALNVATGKGKLSAKARRAAARKVTITLAFVDGTNSGVLRSR